MKQNGEIIHAGLTPNKVRCVYVSLQARKPRGIEFCFYNVVPEKYRNDWWDLYDLAFFDEATGELLEVHGNYMPLVGHEVARRNKGG